jgi:hypothetical protein
MDIEQVYEGLVVFSIAPWENNLPESEYDDGPFFDGQTYVGMGSMTEKGMKRGRR